MFKLINKLGNLVIALYIREAKRLTIQAKQEEKTAQALQAEAFNLKVSATQKVGKVAAISAKAQALKQFFN